MIKRVNLDQTGLGMFLGSTEVHVMRALWHGPKTLADIHIHIVKHYKETQGYSAVNTVLARLIEKGFVARHGVKSVLRTDPSTYYANTSSEKDFIFKCLMYLCTHVSCSYPRAFEQAFEATIRENEKLIASVVRFIPLKDDV